MVEVIAEMSQMMVQIVMYMKAQQQ